MAAGQFDENESMRNASGENRLRQLVDRIYVLDGGRIVESGNHDELMRRAGRYAELFQLQAAAYR